VRGVHVFFCAVRSHAARATRHLPALPQPTPPAPKQGPPTHLRVHRVVQRHLVRDLVLGLDEVQVRGHLGVAALVKAGLEGGVVGVGRGGTVGGCMLG
jgi:hypothetical protein